MQDYSMNRIWLFWPKVQHLTVVPSQASVLWVLGLPCQERADLLRATEVYPLGSMSLLFSLFLFSLPMVSYSESYTILFRHYPTNSYQGEGLKFFNSNHCQLSMYFEEKCVEKPVLSRLLVQVTKTKNFLVNWRAIWTWSPEKCPRPAY